MLYWKITWKWVQIQLSTVLQWDRPLYDKGAKLDNLLQIAHNVEIGSNTVIAAQTGISGSTKVGDNCVVGGQVGMVGHINIANGSQIMAKSGINKNIIEEGKKWGGTPFFGPYMENLRNESAASRLPALEKRVIELEKIIAEMRNS
jgi:UDP-3-O-[3-hydroxymyristoyl] glucosamine N-acyltransferase